MIRSALLPAGFALAALCGASLVVGPIACVGDGADPANPPVEAGPTLPDGSAPAEAGTDAADAEPGAIVVRGRVVDGLGRPVAGAQVAIGGRSMATSADGRFELPAASPYDVTIVHPTADTGSGKAIVVFQGLRTPDPTLQVLARTPVKSVTSVTITTTGAGSTALGTGERIRVLFAPAGTTAAEPVGRIVTSGAPPYVYDGASTLSWMGDSPYEGKAHALRVTLDEANKFPGTISHAGSTNYSFLDGQAGAISVGMTGTPAAAHVTGSIDPGAGATTSFHQILRPSGAGTASISFFDFTRPLPPTFDMLLPPAAYTGGVMAAFDTPSGGQGTAWRHGLAPGATGVALVAPPDLLAVAPAEGATVDDTTSFAWNAAAGSAYRMRARCPVVTQSVVPDHTLTILSMTPSARIPATASLGVTLPSGGQCSWSAAAFSGVTSADTLVGAAGWKHLTGGQEATSDGTIAETATRSFVVK